MRVDHFGSAHDIPVVGRSHQLVRARVGGEIPDLDGPALIARDDLALVRMYRNIWKERSVPALTAGEANNAPLTADL